MIRFGSLWLLSLLFVATPTSRATDDIEKDLQDLQKQMEGLVNIIEKSTGGARPGAPAPGSPPPFAVPERYENLAHLQRKILLLATDQRFMQSLTSLWNHPDRNLMLMAQGGFFIVMFLLRAWRQAKTDHWFKRILLGLFFTFFTWIGITLVIPRIILGEPFQTVIETIWRVITSP